jgi:hypothetical protein
MHHASNRHRSMRSSSVRYLQISQENNPLNSSLFLLVPRLRPTPTQVSYLPPAIIPQPPIFDDHECLCVYEFGADALADYCFIPLFLIETSARFAFNYVDSLSEAMEDALNLIHGA